jgi:hypothetical protein
MYVTFGIDDHNNKIGNGTQVAFTLIHRAAMLSARKQKNKRVMSERNVNNM